LEKSNQRGREGGSWKATRFSRRKLRREEDERKGSRGGREKRKESLEACPLEYPCSLCPYLWTSFFSLNHGGARSSLVSILHYGRIQQTTDLLKLGSECSFLSEEFQTFSRNKRKDP